MPRRISRFGGTTLRRSFITNAYSPAMPSLSSTRLRARLCGPEQAAMLGHHAAILHHTNARARQLRRRAVVTDPELKPHDGRLPRQPEDLAGVARKELRPSEHLDHVDRSWKIGQGGDHRLPEQSLARARGIHANDVVAARLQVRGHVAGRLSGLPLGTEHRDAARLAQDSYEARVVVDEERSPVHRPATISRPFESRNEF